MTIGGFFIVLFIIIGLYGLFKKTTPLLPGRILMNSSTNWKRKSQTSSPIPQSPDFIESFLCTGFFLRFLYRLRIPGEPAYVSQF